jgi:hypothetical protein
VVLFNATATVIQHSSPKHLMADLESQTSTDLGQLTTLHEGVKPLIICSLVPDSLKVHGRGNC